MKRIIIFSFIFFLLTIGICHAADSEMIGVLKDVFKNSTLNPRVCVTGKAQQRINLSWEPPMFRCPSHERITVKVNLVGGGSFNGANSEELAKWIESAVLRQIQTYGPVRNMTPFTGTPKIGDLLLEIDVRVTSGQDFYRNSDSSSRSFNGRHSSENSTSSSQDGAEKSGVYLTLSPILYRIGEGSNDVVASTDARISASESEITSSQEANSFSQSNSYSWGGSGSSNSHSDSSSSEWETDKDMSKEHMFDGLVQRLSKQAVALTFEALKDSLQIERYNSIKNSESYHPTGVVIQDK